MRTPTNSSRLQSFLMPALREQLDPRQPLYQLAQRLPWATFEKAFVDLYSEESRPAKPVRLMVSLLMLKQMFDFDDEPSGAK